MCRRLEAGPLSVLREPGLLPRVPGHRLHRRQVCDGWACQRPLRQERLGAGVGDVATWSPLQKVAGMGRGGSFWLPWGCPVGKGGACTDQRWGRGSGKGDRGGCVTAHGWPGHLGKRRGGQEQTPEAAGCRQGWRPGRGSTSGAELGARGRAARLRGVSAGGWVRGEPRPVLSLLPPRVSSGSAASCVSWRPRWSWPCRAC